jgi:MOSC domain-containing protein YiiM
LPASPGHASDLKEEKTVSTIEQSYAAQDETFLTRRGATAQVVASCISSGGIPKRPLAEVQVVMTGFLGDGHAHEKHIRPDRALSLLDVEILDQLRDEGFDLQPGMLGENLTAVGLSVQDMAPGTLLKIGDVVLRLEQARKPCYVLDAIDVRLKDVLVGRCGYMASVVRGGKIKPGMEIVILMS